MADLYHKGVLKTFDYQVKNEAFSASEYLMWMSLIDSTPENWKVADEAANNVTDYRINVSFIHCLPQKRYIRFSLKKSIYSTNSKKMDSKRIQCLLNGKYFLITSFGHWHTKRQKNFSANF